MPASGQDVETRSQALLHQPQEECQGSHLAHQCQYREDAEIIRQLRQELSKARQCMIELDDHMEQQIQTLGGVDHEERAQSARDNLWGNRYFIWHEVETAKRARDNARAGAI